MKSSARNVKLASVDDLFTTEENRQEIQAEAKREKVQMIPLAELHPFRNHPFKVKDDEAMANTVDSVRQYGENGCRIAAVLLSAAVFVCGTEIRKRSCPGSFGRERFCGQKRRESQRRALASQPLMPSEAIPRIRCFWRKRNRISSGRQVTPTPAIVRFSRLK